MTGANVLEELTTALIIVDRHNHITYLNSAAEDRFDLSRTMALKKSIVTFFEYASEDLTELLQRVRQAHNAYILCALVRCHPHHDENNITCTLTQAGNHDGVLFEFPPERNYATELDDAFLMRSNTKQILSLLAHEVRNPLGGIRGAAQLLQGEFQPDDEWQTHLQIIIDETTRLNDLLQKLQSPSDARPVYSNVHKALYQVAELSKVEYGQLTVEHDFDVSLPEIYCDESALMQTLLNLVRNAAQATQGLGIVRLVSRIARAKALQQHPGKLVVRVDIADNGPGINLAERNQREIYSPAYSTKAQGHGLGLAQVLLFCQSNGAEINYDRVDGFTVFHLYLPT